MDELDKHIRRIAEEISNEMISAVYQDFDQNPQEWLKKHKYLGGMILTEEALERVLQDSYMTSADPRVMNIEWTIRDMIKDGKNKDRIMSDVRLNEYIENLMHRYIIDALNYEYDRQEEIKKQKRLETRRAKKGTSPVVKKMVSKKKPMAKKSVKKRRK